MHNFSLLFLFQTLKRDIDFGQRRFPASGAAPAFNIIPHNTSARVEWRKLRDRGVGRDVRLNPYEAHTEGRAREADHSASACRRVS